MQIMPSKIESLLLFLIIFTLKTSIFSQSDELFFNGFNNASKSLTLNGFTQIHPNGILQLTNSSRRFLGHAFTNLPIRVKNSKNGKVFTFSSIFAFAIVPQFQTLGGHGFTFVFSPTKLLPNAFPSQFLGLLNPTINGNFSNHLFFIEFDEVQDFEFKDINDNHVGVNLNSMISNVSSVAAYYPESDRTSPGGTETRNISMKSGDTIMCWVDYDSSKNQLNVTISPFGKKPSKSLLSYDIDLSPYLDEFMYVGFSASNGLLASSHYIMGWSFKVNGVAKPLDLSSLPRLPKAKKTNFGMVLGVSLSSVIVFFIAIGLSVYMLWLYKNRDVIEPWELDVGPHRFPYHELRKATKGFREKQLLGFGGFGRVYKGTLPKSKTLIAVKRISHESRQGLPEFVAEIASIGRLRHRNLVQLLGWCRRRGDLILVYDYMPNGSLDKYLFDNPPIVLDWDQRFKIVKGVASGLLYLHEEWEQTVIHRDIKAGNVLLDIDFNGRLGDFGLAKLYEHGSHAGTTRVVGTLGYLAPEVTRTGKPMPASDVFAFGALILEVACGRRPIEPKSNPDESVLVDLVWCKWNEEAIFDVMDPNLKGGYNEIEASIVLKLGLMCSAEAYESRPTMRQVKKYLEGEVVLPDVIAPPGGYNVKKVGNMRPGNSTGEFEDFLHSYPASSYLGVSGSMPSLTGGDEGR